MATPVLLPWKIPWMEERGRLQATGSQRVGYDLSDFTFTSLSNICIYIVAVLHICKEMYINIIYILEGD